VRPYPDNARQWPSGYLFSNAEELARFAVAFMDGGTVGGRRALPADALRAMATPRAEMHVATKEQEHWRYGYGLVTRDWRGVQVLEHTGEMRGFACLLRMIPEKRFAVVTLTNKSDAQLEKTAELAAETFLRLAPAPAPAQFNALSLAAGEAARYAGRYANGEQLRAELTVAAGGQLTLSLTSDGETDTAPVVKIAPHTFVAVPAGGSAQLPFVLIEDDGGRVEYLHLNARALKRLAPTL
jgi:CubicO group peptidase (beta-lactamase class C family)